MFRRSLPTRIPRMGMIQWPISGSSTGLQERSSCRCFLDQPPRAMSLSSFSWLARNTANFCVCLLGLKFPMVWARTSIKLNRGVCERPERPRPRMPSKWKLLKGSSESAVAATKWRRRHSGRPEAAAWLETFATPLRQTRSSTYTPVISPVPKETVTESRGPLSQVLPCLPMSRADSEPLRRYRVWALHVSLLQYMLGSTRWPLPVSKTTVIAIAGVPIWRVP
mmetsp:Transcript_30519/g.94835  ORF Transcript_30519/g.94835 Transcript_30519/m.94835 type:complete len:223 (-) Transcript_30519:182-850(-)